MTSPSSQSMRGPGALMLDSLRELKKDWDSYGGEPITQDALNTAQALAAVPLADGGIQLELHAGGVEFEIEITPSGRVKGLLWEARDAD